MASGKIQSGGAEHTPNAPAVDPLNRGTVGQPVTGLERAQDALDVAMERHAAPRVFRPPATEGWFTRSNLSALYPLASAEVSDADWPADGFSGPVGDGGVTQEQVWRSFYNGLARRDQQLRAAQVKREQEAISSSACVVCGSREKTLANGRCWPSCS